MVIEVLLLCAACVAIFLSSNLIIDAVRKITPILKVSRITVSLLVLGLVTSLPEVAVTINSLLVNAPQIAVGNVIGSQIFILFVIIPILAIVSNGLSVRLPMKNVSLSLSLLLALVPMIALYDQKLGVGEIIAIVVLYCLFAFVYTQKSQAVERILLQISEPTGVKVMWQTILIIVAFSILLVASNTAVRSIVEIAAILQTPRFLLSMILLPIATNLPELSLALGFFGAVKRDMALGDYLGSITFNSFLLGLLALFLGGPIEIGQSISFVIFLFVLGIIGLWISCASKESLSPREGLLFLAFYLILLVSAGWQIMSVFN